VGLPSSSDELIVGVREHLALSFAIMSLLDTPGGGTFMKLMKRAFSDYMAAAIV
jgi:hypothetical protein